jgi:Domain of unknown function (DUF222)/HNH endonuclease
MKQASTEIPKARPLGELEAEITELAGHLNAAQHRWLVLIEEFDRRTGWSDGSTQSCAHWLNWKCGVALGAAREKVRVAHAIPKLPRISAAMARGELSYSKVRALTRIACEKTEEYLLNIALHGTAAHVERVVRQFRRAQEAEELSREERQQANRKLTYFYDADGSLLIKGRLPAEVGAQLIKALEAAAQDEEREDVPAETSERPDGWRGGIYFSEEKKPSWGARRADALGRIAESFLKHGLAVLSPGDRQQIIVHVDAQTLREGGAGRCEFEDGPSMAVETARRIACDASTVHLHEDEAGEPLNIGRRSRTIPPALRRALKSRDKGCRFPGCPNTRYVDAHHIHHWAQGGETKLSNLVQLCRFHHRQVHEGRVVIKRLDDGALRFVKPDGRTFESPKPGPMKPSKDWRQSPVAQHAPGTSINAETATTRWRGERMDYDLAIEALCQRVAKRKDVPAGT